ncbi:MAG: GNAT family N-acetyltransferase [Hyphomicrobiaceae bacterium]
MSVRIRRLEARDKARWLELFQGYITFYEATVPDDVVALTWARLLDEAAEFPIALVAVDETDRPIGLAHILFHRSTWSPTHYCYLEDLYVDPDCRARGVGRKLIEATYAEADARGCTRTYWATQEFNDRARSLYDRLAEKSVFVQYRR